MNASSASARPAKRHGLLFKLGVALGILVVLLVILYFVVTSNAFFTGVILPKVSKAANADITVSSASISPWSEVVLNNLKVVPHGREQLVQADVVRARYSLRDIIGGKIVVNEVTLDNPVITYLQNADGTSNVDPLTQKKPEAAPQKEAEKAPSKPGKPAQLDIKNVSLKNARIEAVINQKDGGKQTAQISNFDFNIDQIRNGQPGKLSYNANIAFDQKGTNQAQAGALAAKLAGSFGFLTTPNLEPQSINGNSRLDVTKADGALNTLANFSLGLDCDLTPTEIRKNNLRFEQSGNLLGELRISGPFSAASREGRLKAELVSIDQRVLNMIGKPLGYDFNKTAINSQNDIELKEKGTIITVNGQFAVTNLSVTQIAKKQTTPALNLQLVYQVDVDQNKKSALVRKFDFSGIQNNKRFLQTALSKPLPVSWNGGAGVTEEAALDLTITQLNLADWQSFVADLAPAGTLDSTLHLVSRSGGNRLALDLSSKLNDFSARFGSNQISGAAIQLNTKAQIEDFKKVTLETCQLQLARENAQAVSVSSTGSVNVDTKDVDIKTVLEAQIPQLLNIVKVPDVNASSGSVRFEGQITKAKDTQTAVGTLGITNLTATLSSNRLDRFQTKVDLDVAVKGDDLQIRKANGTLQQAGLPAGSFNVSGGANLKTKAGQFNLKLADLNQNLLRPFLAQALSGKQLVSISVNADANAKLEEGGKTTVQGDFGFTNLVVKATDIPTNALAAQFKLDATFEQQKKTVDLRAFQIALTPTARAKNQINLKGQADLSQTNAYKADLTLQAESIDVTPYYDIFAGGKPAPATAQAKPQPQQQPAPAAKPSPTTEPDAMKLPIQQVVLNATIDRFYLREIAITNWQTGVKMQGSHVVVNPLQLSLNGSPLKSTVDADLSVKGYKYDVNFSLDKTPVEPFVNSFAPDKRDVAKGMLYANAQIKGAGITGPSLRKNLQGQANFGLTNGAVQLQSLKDKYMNSTFVKLIYGIVQGLSLTTTVPDVLSDPLNSVSGNLNMGQGTVSVQSFRLQSAAFIANTHGNVTLADVIADSPLDLPMTFSLSQPLIKKLPAQVAAIASPNANAGYVDLPDFVKIGGTIGSPKVRPNLTLKTGLGALQNLGTGLLGGKTNAPSGTNTAQSVIQGLFGGKTQTNAAPQTNAPAQKFNPFDLIKPR